MKFCSSCGVALVGDAPKFCGECGVALPIVDSQRPSESGSETDFLSALPAAPEFYDGIGSIHDGDRNWLAALGKRITSFAEQWFGSPTVSTTELFALVDPELGESLMDQGAWEGNTSLSTSFVLLPHGFETGQAANPRVDQTIPWDQSSHGRRVVDVIEYQGFSMSQADDRLVGWWSTPGGGACVQFAAIMIAADGLEYLHWYSIPLASMGTMLDNDAARLALTASIPSLLQTVTYLAECPTPTDPDALFTLGGRRRILFGVDDPEVAVPIPVTTLVLTEDSESADFYAVEKDTGLIKVCASGGSIIVGYAIALNQNDYFLSRGIQVAVLSAVRMAGILEDGFSNHLEGEESFDTTLWSQASVVTGADQVWIPTSLT